MVKLVRPVAQQSKNMLKPIKKTRLAEAAVEQIKDLITEKGMEPGAKLPSERELIKQLRISRASVREALRHLEILGLIEVKPGSGAFVREVVGDLFLPLAPWLSKHEETLHNHFEARQVMEPRAAAYAAQRASSSVIQAMRAALATFKEKKEQNDLVGLILSDVEFHRLIALGTGNKTLMVLMDTIARFLLDGWKASLRVPGRIEKTVAEHQSILDAIEKGDSEGASQRMGQHLENALSDLAAAGLK